MSEHKHLSLKDQFIWVEKFDDAAFEKFLEKFLELEAADDCPIIPIFISSYGGSVYNVLAMRDLIKSSAKPVSTHAFGKAMSAGAALLASGTRGLRYATPSTTVMVHEASTAFWGKVTEMKADAVHTEWLNNLFLSNLAEDCGMSLKDLEKLIKDRKNADWFLTAADAKKLGLIDAVKVMRLDTRPQPSSLVEFPSFNEQTKGQDIFGKTPRKS